MRVKVSQQYMVKRQEKVVVSHRCLLSAQAPYHLVLQRPNVPSPVAAFDKLRLRVALYSNAPPLQRSNAPTSLVLALPSTTGTRRPTRPLTHVCDDRREPHICDSIHLQTRHSSVRTAQYLLFILTPDTEITFYDSMPVRTGMLKLPVYVALKKRWTIVERKMIVYRRMKCSYQQYITCCRRLHAPSQQNLQGILWFSC